MVKYIEYVLLVVGGYMEKNYHNEFKNRQIKKQNPFLAFFVRKIFRAISRKDNVEFVYDKEAEELKNKQVVVLVQHKSKNDYIYAYAGIKNKNVHALCGYQNVFQKSIYSLLKNLGIIAKYLYQPDLQATRQMFQVLKLGGSLMIFPEGIQSTSGSMHPINPATINLLCKLKLPVILVTSKGAYFSRTRYSTDKKRGKMTYTYTKLFDEVDYDNFSKEELYNKLLEKFRYNEFEESKNNKVAFRGKKPNIYGLNNIIYKCPHCGSEYTFSTSGDIMTCSCCGFKVGMNEYYDIYSVNKDLPFENIDKWYKWQRNEIRKQVKSDDFILQAKVKYNVINVKKLSNDYSLKTIGEGQLTLTNKGLVYEGSKNGEMVLESFEPQSVYSLTISLDMDVDLYYKNQYMNFAFIDDNTVTKWMLASEEIHNLYDKEWEKASKDVYEYED